MARLLTVACARDGYEREYNRVGIEFFGLRAVNRMEQISQPEAEADEELQSKILTWAEVFQFHPDNLEEERDFLGMMMEDGWRLYTSPQDRIVIDSSNREKERRVYIFIKE